MCARKSELTKIKEHKLIIIHLLDSLFQMSNKIELKPNKQKATQQKHKHRVTRPPRSLRGTGGGGRDVAMVMCVIFVW